MPDEVITKKVRGEPKSGVFTALASANLKWSLVLGEWIDNALDADATSVAVRFGKDFVSVVDNGVGCSDLIRFVQLGNHVQHSRRGLGRFGIGAKDASLWAGGSSSDVNITSTSAGITRVLSIQWEAYAAADWEADQKEWVAKPPTPTGTSIFIKPLQRLVPEGKNLEELISELGYIYSPALKQGRQVTIKGKSSSRPQPLMPWELPAFQEEPLKKVIEVGGKKARVVCGIVKDGVLNPKRGLSYVYRHRVILKASGKGCGRYNFTRVAGYVQIDDSWPINKNKDGIINAEGLYAAVEDACREVLERADKQTSQLASMAFRQEVEGVINRGLLKTVKAKRGPKKRHGKHPAGSGSPHKQAADEQPGNRMRSRARNAIKLAYDEMDKEDIGEYSEGVVVLNLSHPMVARARDDSNISATAVLAASLIVDAQVNGQEQLKLQFTDGSFARILGSLLGKSLLVDGADIHG